ESVEDKSVNFYVENLSLDELLDLLISTNDLVKKPHNENTYVIMTRAEARKYGNKQYKTFKLVNAKPSEVISMITGSKSLAEKIDTGNMAVNDRINALSVYETPENLDLIEKIIENVDEKLKQAVIEVKLLEVNRSVTRELGIDVNSGNGIAVQVADITRIPSSYAIGAKLVMLENQGKAKVLSSPKIRAVHGKQATINIGKKIPVPYFRYEVASTTYLGYVPQTYKEYRDLDTGIELSVTPEISHDNEISLDINLRVDEVIKINDDGQPTRDSRSSHSYIRVKDGETVVLGGLISSQNTEDTSGPALINKIPLLKRLASKTKNVKSDVEMIMLVTPRLVNLDAPAEQTAADPSEIVVQTRN
ncbi:MAG TPA: secretin N-terminal domain-containing protein, partial [Candidatus Ozemobacteraceae bacterium]|nr:secretin N-terminal domain-containing protein [Candidatus Ozemobacteraceae bacterium]